MGGAPEVSGARAQPREAPHDMLLTQFLTAAEGDQQQWPGYDADDDANDQRRQRSLNAAGLNLFLDV